MTTYNTGNPIGSAAVKDLYDNAENLDEFVNSKQHHYYPDRLGVARKTWHGMEEAFQQFLIKSGYVGLGPNGEIQDYAAGLEITERNQVFRYEGELYRAGAALDLPYTTTGDWETDGSLFVAVGDQALRQELSNSMSPTKGASLVGYRGKTVKHALDYRPLCVDSIEEMIGIDVNNIHDGQKIIVVGRRGGIFVWNAENDDPGDGGTLFPSEYFGVFERSFNKNLLNLDWFIENKNEDSTNAITSAISVAEKLGGAIIKASGHFFVDSGNININSDNILISGDGPGNTVFERTNPDISLFMFQWAEKNDTEGGGIVNCEIIGVRNPASGNGGVAFGTSTNYANGYIFKNVVVRRWGQYGVGLYNGNNWHVENIKVFEHGHSEVPIGSCMGFNVFPKLESRNGHLENITSVISDDSVSNSAAIKLEQHQNIYANNLIAQGGTEMCISISAVGGRIGNIKATPGSSGSFPGIVLSSIDPNHPETIGRFVLEDVDCDYAGFTVSLSIASGAGVDVPRLTGCTIRSVKARSLRVNNSSTYADCVFENVHCTEGFRLDHNNAGVSPPQIPITNNRFFNCSGNTFEYLGDSSFIEGCSDMSGSVGFTIRGDNNTVVNSGSTNSASNGLTINGSYNRFLNFYSSRSGTNNVFIQSGSNNVVQGVSHAPTGNHIVDNGTGNITNALVQI